METTGVQKTEKEGAYGQPAGSRGQKGWKKRRKKGSVY
jgi:hypothetical protein